MMEAAYYATRMVTPLEPKTVVLYEGDNDPFDNQSPADVRAALEELVRRVRNVLPNARFLILGVKPSPSRQDKFAAYREINRLLKEWAAKDGNAAMFDLWDSFLGTDGKPRPELFDSSGLHLTAAGYQIFTEALRPYLQQP